MVINHSFANTYSIVVHVVDYVDIHTICGFSNDTDQAGGCARCRQFVVLVVYRSCVSTLNVHMYMFNINALIIIDAVERNVINEGC